MLSKRSTFSGFSGTFWPHFWAYYWHLLFLSARHPTLFEELRSDITEAPDEHDHELHGPAPAGVEVASDLVTEKDNNDAYGFEAWNILPAKLPIMYNGCLTLTVMVLETWVGRGNPRGDPQSRCHPCAPSSCPSHAHHVSLLLDPPEAFDEQDLGLHCPVLIEVEVSDASKLCFHKFKCFQVADNDKVTRNLILICQE